MKTLFTIIIICLCIVPRSVNARKNAIILPAKIKQKYDYLYKLKVTKLSDGSYSFHKGRLFLRDRIRVLYLSGDPFEMAFQHGKLLKNEILNGALLKASEMIPNMIANALGERPVIVNAADLIIRLLFNVPLYFNSFKNSNSDSRKLFLAGFGLSESTGIPILKLLRAQYAPDVLMLLSAKMENNTILANPMLSNCSDFAAWDSYSKSGELIIGRNMDYPFNGYFDEYPTIIYFSPDEPGAHKYLAVTSAGVHNSGFTAINDAGIFIGAHTIPSNDVSVKGKPGIVVAGEVVKKASTFEEALSMFSSNLPATSYTYTLISTKEKRIAGIELSSSAFSVRESKFGYHAQSNHFLTPSMVAKNLSINHSVDEDSLARLKRMEELLNENKGKIDERTAMAILADKWDPFAKKISGHMNTIAVHTTMSSVVILPERGIIYVSNGKGPVSHGKFISFPLPEFFDPEKYSTSNYTIIDNTSFKDEYPEVAKAEQYFIEAKKTYEYDNDTLKAYNFMKQAATIDNKEANYQFMLAILAIKEGFFSEAMNALNNTINLNRSKHLTLLAKYYRGRINAHFKNEKLARNDFNAIIDEDAVDQKLKNATLIALEKLDSYKRYSIEPNKLHLLMQWSDLENY